MKKMITLLILCFFILTANTVFAQDESSENTINVNEISLMDKINTDDKIYASVPFTFLIAPPFDTDVSFFGFAFCTMSGLYYKHIYGFEAITFPVSYAKVDRAGFSFLHFCYSYTGKDAIGFFISPAGHYVGDTLTGVTIGGINIADKVKGVQIGVVNYTNYLKGVQIGLVNIIAVGPGLTFFPVINMAFSFE